jgi:hypothetical protein
MKQEYDFSKGVRGKFYNPNTKLNIPIYLDNDVAEFISKYAEEKKLNADKVVNEWLRNNIALIRSVL